jgi:Xaa-Pro dipeptidase
MDRRTENTIDAAVAVGADWVLLTSIESVTYATRHVAVIETGPSPFNGGPTTALVGRDGSIRLVCNELERRAASKSDAVEVHHYESLGFSDLRPLTAKYLREVTRMLDEGGVSGTVAVESASCPASVTAALGERARIVMFDEELARRRAIKTEEEVAALRQCAALTATGQAAALKSVRPGDAELFAWREVRLAMEMEAKVRVPVAGDFISGRQRTARVGGFPTDRVMQEGDSIICDLAPQFNGYWGDSCVSFSVGPPSAELSVMYRVVYRALEAVYEGLGPGVVAGDFDAKIRGIIIDAGYGNPVHIGHGIGTSVHEWPRIVPRQTAVIEPGMVFMVEPGAYHPDIGGARLEQMFLITERGNEVLSPFTIEREMPAV